MLEQNASHFGARGALLSDGDEPLSHQQLRNQVALTVTALNSLGVGRADRVAIVLPQGPDLAVTFLAVAAGATAALCGGAAALASCAPTASNAGARHPASAPSRRRAECDTRLLLAHIRLFYV